MFDEDITLQLFLDDLTITEGLYVNSDGEVFSYCAHETIEYLHRSSNQWS